jgi:hypothetical protein
MILKGGKSLKKLIKIVSFCVVLLLSLSVLGQGEQYFVSTAPSLELGDKGQEVKAFAHTFEQATDWHTRLPTVSPNH